MWLFPDWGVWLVQDLKPMAERHKVIGPNRSNESPSLRKPGTEVVVYLLVRCDGHSEHFDSMVLGFVRSLLDASTLLFVTSDGMAISHYHNVLVLMIVGTPAYTNTQQWHHCCSFDLWSACVCVMLSPSEQLSEASPDGAVSLRPQANVFDAVNVLFEVAALSFHVT